jgi:hypothetical protein
MMKYEFPRPYAETAIVYSLFLQLGTVLVSGLYIAVRAGLEKAKEGLFSLHFSICL